MDNPMAVSREKIKALREARAWSQAHLAEAASLSLRTVQRVEAEGTASAETRLAIAAALGVSVDELSPTAVAPEPPMRSDPGPINTLLMFVTTGAALMLALWLGRRLPLQVASHFGVGGEANATMSRDNFVAAMCLTMVVFPMGLWSLLGFAARHGKVKIPNAAYWFTEPRRLATERFLHAHTTWLCIGTSVFLAYMFWLVVTANAQAPSHPALDMTLFNVGLGAFLVAMAAWITVLGFRFRRDPKAAAG